MHFVWGGGKSRKRANSCLMKKSLFVPKTLEKLFKSSSSMWKSDPCVTAEEVKQTYGDLENWCRLLKLKLPRGKFNLHNTFFQELEKQILSREEAGAVTCLFEPKLSLFISFLFSTSFFPFFSQGLSDAWQIFWRRHSFLYFENQSIADSFSPTSRTDHRLSGQGMAV